MEKIKILVIDSFAENHVKERLERNPEFEIVGSTTDLGLAHALAERFQPVVILLNVDLLGDEGLSSAETFVQEFPASSLILMTGSNSSNILRYALSIGAKEVLELPIHSGQLVKSIRRVVQQEVKRMELFTNRGKKRSDFKTITVFSTKGGVGKTTIALNLAIAIRQMTKKRVALIDLNLHSGNAALLAGVPWRRSIKDLVDDINNMDEDIINSYCTEHSSGLKILPAPILTEYAAFIQAEHVEKILELMSKVFNYVIVDAPTGFHDTIIPALEQSQDIVLVTTLDLASVQCLKQCMILLNGLSVHSRIRVVVNKMGYSGGLKTKDIEKELGTTVQCIIPDCGKIAIDAVNLGKPILMSAKNSSVAKVLVELATRLIAKDKSPALNGVVSG